MKKSIMLTPGPTPLPPSVLKAMAQPILHHRTHEYCKLMDYTLQGLKYVLRTDEATVLMMTCSGTGGMESAVANLLAPGDKVLVHTTGAFGDRFVKIIKTYGIEPAVIAEEWGRAASQTRLREALKANPGLKAVFLQHTDTSTGIVNDLENLSAIVHDNSDAIVVVDSVSGLAAEPLEMDRWNLDVVVTASQKGLMNAPGLAFVGVNARAWKVAEQAKLPRFYFDWQTMKKFLPNMETPYTPGVSLVAGQAEALRLIREEGIENVWKRTAELAAYTRAWAKEFGLPLFAKDPANILTALILPQGADGEVLIRDILRDEGISIAGGQVQLKGKIIRLAHMGYISKADLDAGFAALAKRLKPVRA